jgi:class 3 adenylate cyclase/CHASE2 domain-containing sensor protein
MRRWSHGLTWGIVTLSVAFGTQLLSRTRFFQLLSQKAYDANFVLRGERPTSNVVLVVADEKALNTFPELQAFWHPYYAKAIRGAQLGGAKVVALDIAFGIPVEKWAPGNDAILADAVASAQIPVVIGMVPGLLAKQRDWPIPVNMIASALGLVGYSNLTVDSDEFVRRQELLETPTPEAPSARSFSLKIVERFLDQEAVLDGGQLRLNGKLIRSVADRQILIDFAGPAGTFPRISLADFVAATQAGHSQQLKDWVAGKIVMIGLDSFDDRFPTPFYTGFQGLRWTTAGVEIHANTINTILGGQYLVPAPSWLGLLALLAIAFATFGAAARLRASAAMPLAVAVLVCALATSHFLFRAGYTLSGSDLSACWLLTLLVSIIYRFVAAEHRRDHFRRAVTMFVGHRVASSLDGTSTIALSGTRQFVTVLFTDIRGFTSFCEDKDPTEVVNLLNHYLQQMVSIVVKHGGHVNKFIGDGILAVFSDEEGAHIGNHPARAVRCAMEIVTAPSQFQTGAGIHTGMAVIGNVGSQEKMEYTILGDTVNVASRMESLNKERGTRLLMSQATQIFLEDEFELTRLGSCAVKGQSEPIEIYTATSLLPPALAEKVPPENGHDAA